MQTEDSIKIINRFFGILRQLTKLKLIRGKGTFAKKYGVSQPNLKKLENEPWRDIFQVAWIYYLERDFKVSSSYIITGKGKKFLIPPVPQKKFVYKKRKKETLPRKPYKPRAKKLADAD